MRSSPTDAKHLSRYRTALGRKKALTMEEGVFPIGSDPHEGVFRSVSEAEVSLDEMLSLACRQGKQDIVELLLESGANVNHRNKAGNTPLLEACSQGHVSIARLLLDRNADIDAPTETTYDSALTWACTLGNVEIVRLLLDKRANVEHRTKDGCTALMFAALAGHEKVAKLLLDHNAEINVESDSNKDSPLTFACWKGHQKVVELFLERNADIEHRTKEGFSPLMFAALGGHTQVAEILLKHHAEVNNPSGSNNDIPLTSACWKGHHQVVELLLQYNSDIEHRTKDGCTPLMLAAREGHLSVAQLLLVHGAKVNTPSGSENNIPLTLACWKGHRDVVNLLLKNVSNIEHQNKAGCTPLMLAAREGHKEATRLLLDSGAQINIPSGSNDDTPLTLACWKGHEEVVSLLIERHSNVNHQTKTGCTPLMEATREGHVGVAKLLLEAGADVETPDNYGQSPFFMACWKGHADVAALLLDYDANKDCRTKTGITPLFQACRENHVEVVKLLLDYGCNPSTPFPNSRECPLTLAAEKGYVELTQLLLSRSASVEARTKKGCSPLYLACREGYKEIAVMLAKHGASTEACDLRGTTPLLAAYKNGHFEVVEWLLAHVAHLPSDPECNKALMAPMPSDTDLAPQRSKCIELIMKAKKAREQAALKNAQILCEELDAEKEKKESRRKAAAKKRDKRKKKKQKEQAEKMDAQEVEKEDVALPVDGREGPDGEEEEEEEEESSAHPQPPHSPENSLPGKVAADSQVTDHFLLKKKAPRGGKKGKGVESSPEAVAPALDDGSDSGDDEFHDALDFSPAEPLDHRYRDKIPLSVSPLVPPTHPSPTSSPSSSSSSSHDGKQPLSSETDMSATTRSGEQTSKRTPQPKAEVFPSTSGPGTSRNSEPAPGVERNRNEQVRGNQGVGLDSYSERRKGVSSKSGGRRMVIYDKEMATLNPHVNQKNRIRDVGNVKTPSPTTSSPPIATKGVSSSSSTTSSSARKVDSTSDGKPVQSHSRGGRSLKQTSTRTHRSNPTSSSSSSSESVRRQARDHSSPSSAVSNNSSHDTRYSSSSTKVPVESNWNKIIGYPNASTSEQHQRNKTPERSLPHAHSEQKPLYDEKEDYTWDSSQESLPGEWEVSVDENLLWTDDDKLRSQKLKRLTTPTFRPSATSAYPTPISNTSTSSSSSTITTTSTQSWQEVTRTTRIVQLTVPNSLVGRIIGRGGSKINSIQAASGAHINVSRNIPNSTERLITIKGTQRSISKAQELIEEALSTPDNTLEVNSVPLLERGSNISPLPSSPSPSNNHSESPSSLNSATTLSRQMKPNHSATTAPETLKSSSLNRRVVKEPIRHVSTASLTNTSDSYKSVVNSNSRPMSWTTSSNTYSSVAAAAVTATGPSPITIQTPPPPSTSPTQEEQSLSSGSSSSSAVPPPPASSLVDSDEDRVMSPIQRAGSPSASEGVVSNLAGRLEVVDMNSDFPPLSVPAHSRSRSDSQVLLLSEKEEEITEPTSLAEEKNTLHSQRVEWSPTAVVTVTSTADVVSTSVTFTTQSSASQSEELSLSSAQVVSEKLPFVSSPKSPSAPVDENAKGSAYKGQEKLEPTSLQAAEESVLSSLAVGARPKVPRSMAPTLQPEVSLPAKFPSSTSQSNSSPDLTAIPPPTSRAGKHGAIGQPTRRRSLPAPPAKGPSRKMSYAGFSSTLEPTLEHIENDPLTGFAPPLSSPHSSHWHNERRGRSTSLTGQHPFISQNGPFPQPLSSFKGPFQSEEPVVTPGSPDTPHGENHPMNDQDFSTPGGVYGAIGSNMPSGGIGAAPSSSTRSLPSTVGIGAPYNSPLSSPRLPHPPPALKGHSDIWIPPFGATGPRVPHTQMVPTRPAFGLPPFPQQLNHHPHPHFPLQVMGPVGMTKPSSDSHMLQRAAMGQQLQQKPPAGVAGGIGESITRRSFGEESSAHRNGNVVQQHKRWSVPNYPHNAPPPVFQPNNRGDVHQPWGAWNNQTFQGGPGSNKVMGVGVNGHYSLEQPLHSNQYNQVGSNALSMSDPWSPKWSVPPSPGFPGPRFSHHNGPALPISTAAPAVCQPGEPSRVGKLKVGRSLSCVTEPSWISLEDEMGFEVTRSNSEGGGGTDLLQLLKSLDISSEHVQSLKARKLSLQQLHSMSDDEWRGLKLPVGPRVKLMNAISNIRRKGDSGSGQGEQGQKILTSETSSSFSAESSIVTS